MSERNGSPTHRYLLFLWSPSGYSIEEREGELPKVGDGIDDGGLVVSKIGPSPLPEDARLCVYSTGKG